MSYNRLLQPKINPFGLIIYFPKEGTVTLKTFSDNIISSSELYKYKEQGTYCNSFNDLFISEGKDFWIINNSTFSIKKKKTPIEKKNHTMIFLSSLTGTSRVFLVGGADKKTFYYDLKKNYFINWAETNEFHNKPALIRIGDYLYIFDNLKQSKCCFERTKLSENENKWEKIMPNFDRRILSYFPANNFATTIDSNGKIVFLGGENISLDNNKTYVYDPKNNKISLSLKGTNDNMSFCDKTFYKTSNKYSVALPHHLYSTQEIAAIDKEEQSLIKINIDSSFPINDIPTNFQYRNNNMYENDFYNQQFNYPSKYSNKTYGICKQCQNSQRQNGSNIQLKNYSQYSYPQRKQRNLEGYYINNNSLYTNIKTNAIIYDEPKEFGYCISSNSSEEVRLKAKNDNIQIVKTNVKYTPIKIGQLSSKKAKTQQKKNDYYNQNNYDNKNVKYNIDQSNQNQNYLINNNDNYLQQNNDLIQNNMAYNDQQWGNNNELENIQSKQVIKETSKVPNYQQYQTQYPKQYQDQYQNRYYKNQNQNIDNNNNMYVKND